jgi:hypothetical protein
VRVRWEYFRGPSRRRSRQGVSSPGVDLER